MSSGGYHPSIYSNVDGTVVALPSNMHQNFGVWWDGDLYRETLDGTTIGDWNYTHGRVNYDLDPTVSGTQSTSAFPPSTAPRTRRYLAAISSATGAVIWRRSDNTALHIYTTTIATSTPLTTLMHDSQYRTAIAWQNVAYNLRRTRASSSATACRRPPRTFITPRARCPARAATLGARADVAHAGEPLVDRGVRRGSATSSSVARRAAGLYDDRQRRRRHDLRRHKRPSAARRITTSSPAKTASAKGRNRTSRLANVPLPAPWIAGDIGAVTMAGGTTVQRRLEQQRPPARTSGARPISSASRTRRPAAISPSSRATAADQHEFLGEGRRHDPRRRRRRRHARHGGADADDQRRRVPVPHGNRRADAGPNVANVPVGSWVKLSAHRQPVCRSLQHRRHDLEPDRLAGHDQHAGQRPRGLAVTSHNTAALTATATFNSVAVTPIVTGSVAGKIFHDTNADNVAGAGDPPLGDVTVYLDANRAQRARRERTADDVRRGRRVAPSEVSSPARTVRTLASDFVSAGDPPVVVSSGGSSTADVPHAPDRPRRHGRERSIPRSPQPGGPDRDPDRRRAAYSVVSNPPSLTFNLLGGDDTLTLDLPAVSLIPSAASNSMAATARFRTVHRLDRRGRGWVEFNAGSAGMVTSSAHGFLETESLRFDGNGGWHTVVVNAGPPVTFPDACAASCERWC